MRGRGGPVAGLIMAALACCLMVSAVAAQLEAEAKGGTATYNGVDVNVSDGSRLARFHVAFAVQCVDEASAVAVTSPQMREAIVLFLRGQTVAGLRSPLGQRQLKRELLAVINKELGAPRAINLYFTQFVVQ